MQILSTYIKYRLIYIFHIMKNLNSLDENKLYEVHFKCLYYFRYVWNDFLFIITADDLNNPLIAQVKLRLSNIFYDTNITFIVEKNVSIYREGQYFYDYIYKKLNDYDGYTFFAHTKGVYNYYNNVDVTDWVLAMYYFSLNRLTDVHTYINDQSKYYLYGGIYTPSTINDFTHKWVYNGSFYWMNTKKIYKYIIENNLSDNIELSYSIAEMFGSLLFNEDQIAYYNLLFMREDFRLEDKNKKICLYNELNYFIENIFTYYDVIEFYKFKENILNDIK